MRCPRDAVFARSTGRMMRLSAVQECTPGSVVVQPHPKGQGYKRCASWEKTQKNCWPEAWLYRPGISAPLDLLERAEWSRFYPEHLKFAS